MKRYNLFLCFFLLLTINGTVYPERYLSSSPNTYTWYGSYVDMGYRYIDHWANHSYGWYLNQNGAGDGLSFNDVEASAILSHDTWTSSSVSTTDLTINYLGATTATWGNDGINTVFWAEDGDPAFEVGGPLYGINPGGITCVKVNSNYEFIEADVIMNGKKVWEIGGIDPELHDMRNCLTHEVGHTIGLGHPSSMTTPAQTMWVYVPPPDDPRDLTDDDIVGVSFLYGGKITDNRTLGGSLYFNWPISVVAGKILTLNSGSTLNFESAASLNVNGTLIANGTSTSKVTFDFISPNSTTQNGLKFNPGSSGTINNAIIKNGYYGVSVTGNPTGTTNITNSAISNSSYALYISGNTSSNVNITGCDIGTSSGGININSGVANIDGCTIHNITTYGGGAVMFNNSGGTIKNCSIQNNLVATNGISILNNSSPYVFQNTIANNTLNGVYVLQSSPSLQSNVISTTGYNHAAVSNNTYSYTLFGKTSYPYDGYNTINGSFYGIYVSNHSIIQAGYSDIARYNRILDNSYRNTYVIGTSTLYAKNDWWGIPVNTTKFYTETGSYFYYLPYLTTDPLGSQNIVSSHGLTAEANVASSTTNYSPEEELLLKAKELQQKHQTNEAIGIYKELIKTYEDKSISEIALVELSNIYRQTKDKNEKDYLENFKLPKNNKNRLYPIALELLSHINKEEGNLSEALADCETLIKEFPSTEHEKNALMNKFFLYYDSKDISSAKTIVEKLTNSFSESPEVAAVINLLDMQELGKEYFPPKVNAEDNSKKDSLVENYEINNYPNPFNPVTTINYQLPKSGSVTLKIFDILGNEIRTLVNEQKETGKYTAQFDASSLASGMYVYQLRVNDYIAVKKMMLVK